MFPLPREKLSAGKYNFPTTAPAKLHLSARISTRIEVYGYFRAGGSSSASFIYRFYRQSCAFPSALFPPRLLQTNSRGRGTPLSLPILTASSRSAYADKICGSGLEQVFCGGGRYNSSGEDNRYGNRMFYGCRNVFKPAFFS